MSFKTPAYVYDLPDRDEYLDRFDHKLEAKTAWNQLVRAYHRTTLGTAQNWKCCFCGVEMCRHGPRWRNPTLEHVIPKSLGGPDHPDNYAVSCHRCNTRRGTLSYEEFMETDGRGLAHPRYLKDGKNRKQRELERRLRRYVKNAEKHFKNGWIIKGVEQNYAGWLTTIRIPDISKLIEILKDKGLIPNDYSMD